MSNLIPPLLSSSPPPIVGPLDEDEDDDEFGDFRAATNSYECDDYSLPSSPQKSADKVTLNTEEKSTILDINSNNNEKISDRNRLEIVENICEKDDKDFQDKRKTIDDFDDDDDVKSDDIQVNSSNSLSNDNSSIFNEDSDDKADNSEENGPNTDLNFESCDNSKNNGLSESNKTEDSGQIKTDSINNDEDNDFGDFETHFDQSPIENEAVDDKITKSDSTDSQIEESRTDNIDDDFDDFQTTEFDENPPISEESKESNQTDENFANFQNIDDNFANFPSTQFEEDSNLDDKDDDFGDFETPSTSIQQSHLTETINKDDFDDFTEFTSNQPVLLLDSNDVVNKCETIVSEIFPKIDDNIDDFRSLDNTEDDKVFNLLKDVTETQAINYQWSKSNSQKVLLKALNIDMRNILYGPAWSCMPRFASNLGLTPLEPIKPEILTPTPVHNQSSPSVDSSQKEQIHNVDIPNVQFDWNDSGLINPLDSTPSKNKATINEEPNQNPEKSDLFLTITEKIKNLTSTTIDDYKIKDLESPKMIPLRETHISNNDNISLEKPDWFQSTIQTPELPRKDDFLNDNNDDFDDFQMVLPDKKIHIVENSINQPIEETSKTKNELCSNSDEDNEEFTDFHSSLPTVLQPVPLEPLKPSIINPILAPTQINWPEPGVSDEEIRNIELSYSRNKIDDKNNLLVVDNELFKHSQQQQDDDDEWSDFVSVTPIPKPVTIIERTSTPDLPLSVLNLNYIQPAKPPIPVITPNGLVQTKLSTNIENSPKSTNIVQTTIPMNYQQPTLITNQFNHIQSANFDLITPNYNQSGKSTSQVGLNDDDDDWSDFVSSQPAVNGYQTKISVNRTNITTNPNFDTFQTYPIRKNSVINGQQNNGLSNIATIPDLDFIAPKSRTNKK